MIKSAGLPSRSRPVAITRCGLTAPVLLLICFFSQGLFAATNCVFPNGGIVTIDYPVVEITPELQLNGAPLVTSEENSVQIWLAQDGDLQVLLGESHLPVVPVRVIAGTYDLVYRDLITGTPFGLPSNTNAIFQRDVVIDQDGPLVANVITATLTGELLLDGAPFPASAAEDGNVYAVGTSGEGEVFLYKTSDGPFGRILVAGQYRIVYRHESGGSIAPRNENAVIDTLDLAPGGNNLTTDITTHLTSGDFLVNGAAAPVSLLETGFLEMRREPFRGFVDVVPLGESRNQNYSLRIIEGSYSLFWMNERGRTLVPANIESRIPQLPVTVDGSPIDVDVPMRTYAGTFTVNGGPAPVSPLENGSVSFIDPVTGAETEIEELNDQNYSFGAIPGDYDLAFRNIAGVLQVPANDFKVFATNVEFSDEMVVPPLDIDIPMTNATRSLFLDGQPWNAGAGEANLWLYDAQGAGEGQPSYEIGSSDDGGWSENLVSGDYRVRYNYLNGNGVPRNGFYVMPEIKNLAGANDLIRINIDSMEVTPVVTLNGAAFPAGQSANFGLLDLGAILFGEASGTWPTFRIAQGEYTALYNYQSGADIPQNLTHLQTCVRAASDFFLDGFEGP